MNSEESESLRMEHNVFDNIKSGKTKMRPRWYFAVRTALVAIAVMMLFLLLFFIASFTIFVLQVNGGFFAIHFGFSGFETFIGSLPWSLLLLSIALILILVILLRRYPFIYHQPFLYTLLALIVVISLATFILMASSFHAGIFRYASRNQLPLINGVYQFETTSINNVYRGQIISLIPNGFVLENAIGHTSTVVMAPSASSEVDSLQMGDYVIIFGQHVATDTLEASGVERAAAYQ
jgi:hypothetical protein